MTYDANDIIVLKGLEAVRLRPGMYIGDTNKEGFHHLIWEIVDNSIDEAMNGFASVISVTLSDDKKYISVADNGRGIPVGINNLTGKSGLEIVFTELHSGAKFNNNTFKFSGGLHGVGASVVNALSKELTVNVYRNGKIYTQVYSRGIPKTEVIESEGPKRKITGTVVSFSPDPDIFGDQIFDLDVIKNKLELKSFLHPGLTLTLDHNKETWVFKHDGGLTEYVELLVNSTSKKTITPVLGFSKDSPKFEAALCWTESTSEVILSYANSIYTPLGGSHEQALKSGIIKAIKTILTTKDLKGLTVTSDDIKEGIVCVISVFISRPQFQSQTKDKLNNPEIISDIEMVLKQSLEKWLLENPTQTDTLLNRIILAAKAREAARVASQTSRKGIVHRLNLPGKLADCSSNDPMECELFIVEGDSAGGSAKQGRDRNTQAILPLRGKVLNTEQASTSKIIANKELQDIILALGCGFGKDLDLSKLRYHKIFLLMDADSDGYHISVLLLTFFYRYLRQIIEGGHLYLAQPPLYKLVGHNKVFWVSTDEEKNALVHKEKIVDIVRFKGLGEMMPKTLWETTLNPKTRTCLRVDIQDDLKTNLALTELMGKDPTSRFEFIMANAKFGDIDI